MRQSFKKAGILILIASMLPLYGCGGTVSGGNMPMGRYVEDILELPENAGNIAAQTIDGDGMLNLYAQDDEQKWSRYKTKDGESWKNEALEILLPEGETIQEIAYDNEGQLYILTAAMARRSVSTTTVQGPQAAQTQGIGTPGVQGAPPVQSAGTPGAQAGTPGTPGAQAGTQLALGGASNLYKVNSDNTLEKIDVNWASATGMGMGMSLSIVSGMMFLENGDFVIEQAGIGVVQYGPDGSQKRTYGDSQTEAFTVSGNKIYLCDSRSNAVMVYDGDTYEQEKSLSFDSLTYQTSIATGQNGVVYIYNSNGVFRLLPDGTIFEKIIEGDMTSLSMPDNNLQGFGETDDGVFFVLANTNGQNGANLFRYTYNPDIAARPENELVVFTLYDNRTLRQAAGVFQKMYPNTRINIQVGMGDDGATVSDIVKTLNTEIMAGKGPDIIMLDGINAYNYIDKGILLDISNLVSEVSGKDKMIENVLKAFESNGKIYAVPAKFSLPTIFVDADAKEAVSGISQLAEFAKANGDTAVIGNKTASNLFKTFLPGSMPGWLNGKEIDEEKLTQYLEAVKAMADTPAPVIVPLERRTGADAVMIRRGPAFNDNESNPEDVFNFAFGKTNTYVTRLSSFRGLMMPNAAASHRGDYAALPLPGLVENVFVPSVITGINAKSGYTDIARDFLKTILSKDVQSVKLGDGFAVNVSALEDSMEDPEAGSFAIRMMNPGFEGETLEAGPPSAESQQKILDLCLSVKTPYIVDNTLAEMVSSEAEGYFSGEKDLARTIADIKERTRIYLAE